MSELTRRIAETNKAFMIFGVGDESGAALVAERAEWLRVEKSLRAQLATEISETQKARAEVERLRKLVEVLELQHKQSKNTPHPSDCECARCDDARVPPWA